MKEPQLCFFVCVVWSPGHQSPNWLTHVALTRKQCHQWLLVPNWKAMWQITTLWHAPQFIFGVGIHGPCSLNGHAKQGVVIMWARCLQTCLQCIHHPKVAGHSHAAHGCLRLSLTWARTNSSMEVEEEDEEDRTNPWCVRERERSCCMLIYNGEFMRLHWEWLKQSKVRKQLVSGKLDHCIEPFWSIWAARQQEPVGPWSSPGFPNVNGLMFVALQKHQAATSWLHHTDEMGFRPSEISPFTCLIAPQKEVIGWSLPKMSCKSFICSTESNLLLFLSKWRQRGLLAVTAQSSSSNVARVWCLWCQIACFIACSANLMQVIIFRHESTHFQYRLGWI